MSIPEKCTVLVVGGGPAGSYAATLLAREGIDTVLLEAEKFPRYHIGESMLPSIRHFFKLIDLDTTFDSHGFRIKKGATFRLNHALPPAYTDFIAGGGPNAYAYNVVRSEADDILFKHAGASGAKTFDGVKVDELALAPSEVPPGIPVAPLRPTAAVWTRKEDGVRGNIKFDYLIDASGRAGLISTKYLKNRHYNQGLKSIANWGYWKNAGTWGVGTRQEGAPYFEALEDGSGWAWFIPLHNGTTSVGIVMKQSEVKRKKGEAEDSSTKKFYDDALKITPNITQLLSGAELVTDIKSASDWSYNATTYSCPYTRLAGDAGCFIDPFFSSGYHIALATGLSAAATIAGSIRKDVDEITAAAWHSKTVIGTYSRFLLVVLSSMRQIYSSEEAILNDWDEESFDRAFAFFRPIIQGTVDADTTGKVTKEEISNAINFCSHAFEKIPTEEKDAVLEKIKGFNVNAPPTSKTAEEVKAIKEQLNDGEKRALDAIRARPMLRFEHSMNIESFNFIIIDGWKLNLERGSLGMIKSGPPTGPPRGPPVDVMGLMMGDGKPDEDLKEQPAAQPVAKPAAQPAAQPAEQSTEPSGNNAPVAGAETDTPKQKTPSTWSRVTSFFAKWRK